MQNYEQRGILTEAVQEKARAFLQREITVKELRLYPYLDYCWKNGGRLDTSKIDLDELSVIDSLCNTGLLGIVDVDRMTPTRELYDYVQDVLAEAYVVIKGDRNNEN